MHRVGQLVSHLTARVSADDQELAHRILPERARGLFDGMPVADRRHAVDVARRLLERGIDDPDLLAAALLHDAAKGHRLRLWHRVGGVLLAHMAPGALERLSSPDPARAGYAWYVFVHHPRLSADAALAEGLSPRAAAFIRAEDLDDADAGLVAALHRADEMS